MLRTFFSFFGRIGRQTFWLAIVALIVLLVLAVAAVVFLVGMPVLTPNVPPDLGHPYFKAVGLLSLFSIWPSLAIYVKRLHDRDMRGWWIILPNILMLAPFGVMLALNPQMMTMITEGGVPAGGGFGGPGGLPNGGAIMMGVVGISYLIAMIILLWLFIVTGFLRGTNGPNRFGADPLGGTGVDAVPEGHDWAN